MDYPPKIEIDILSVPTSPDSGPLCLHVDGLNRKCVFKLLPGITSYKNIRLELKYGGASLQKLAKAS